MWANLFLKVITLVITMKIKIRQIGNSLGVILPKETLGLMGLQKGDSLDLDLQNKEIQIILKKRRK